MSKALKSHHLVNESTSDNESDIDSDNESDHDSDNENDIDSDSDNDSDHYHDHQERLQLFQSMLKIEEKRLEEAKLMKKVIQTQRNELERYISEVFPNVLKDESQFKQSQNQKRSQQKQSSKGPSKGPSKSPSKDPSEDSIEDPFQNPKESQDFSLLNCKEIPNLVTETNFKIVSTNNAEELDAFELWAQDIKARAQTQHVTICIDCEGDNLGSKPHSLSLVQIGEVFDDSFDIRIPDPEPESIPNVGNKPGFAILFPAPQKAIDALSLVLNEPNVIKCTFDFTSDFTCLLEEGVLINPKNIFDAQLILKAKSFLENTSAPGLKTVVKQTAEKKIDPLAQKAYEKYFYSKSTNFQLFNYQNNDKSDEERRQLQYTLEFFEMAILDVVLTGLAVKLRILQKQVDIVFKNSTAKWNEIMKINKQYNSPIAAPLIRQNLFFEKYVNYEKPFQGKDKANTGNQIEKLLVKWDKCRNELCIMDLIPTFPFTFKKEIILKNYKSATDVLSKANFSLLIEHLSEKSNKQPKK